MRVPHYVCTFCKMVCESGNVGAWCPQRWGDQRHIWKLDRSEEAE